MQALLQLMQKIAIFTANGESLSPMLDLIKRSTGVDLSEDRYVIVGCERVPGFDAVAKGEPVVYDIVAPGIIGLAKETLASDPAIKAFLFECTQLPPFADDVRAKTGLPVYTSITCTDSFMSGLMDNPLFGLNDWHGMGTEACSGGRADDAGYGSRSAVNASVDDVISAFNVLLARTVPVWKGKKNSCIGSACCLT